MFDQATLPDLDCDITSESRVSEVISALSYALDLAEGQPAGHAVRTCLIGMRIAEELKLDSTACSALYYALLLKDLGGSCTASKLSYLFGADDHCLKRNLTTVDWESMSERFQFVSRNVMPDGSPLQRALRGVVVALEGPSGASRIALMRSERGAAMCRRLGFPEQTATAIRHLDEHWDGRGQPNGLKWEEISLFGRIACLAQSIDVFFCAGGRRAALDMARERRGTWFDPALVDCVTSFADEEAFWNRVCHHDVRAQAVQIEPADRVLMANEAALDRIARAFAQVVDAKSQWTFQHSDGVARIAVGMANVLGLSPDAVSRVYRAGLLHDIGKLGVSNLILDKPGGLTSEEYTAVRQHTDLTHQILGRVPGFDEITEIAASHHERIDGRGYHRGISADKLPIESRVLAVADMCEALSAKRPYRDALPRERMLETLREGVGTAVCRDCVEALQRYLDRSEIIGRVNDHLDELERLMQNL